MNNKNTFLLIAGLSLSFALPTYSFAAETETTEEDAYATRLALANEIKKYRAMRKELPIPPPAGLFGVYAFPEEGQYVVGLNMQQFKFSGMLQGSDSISYLSRSYNNASNPPLSSSFSIAPNHSVSF